ncbi:MAG TPA: GNAT family N-acetyltransferase, partial [Dehalococcoidia bacterium]|nr:GNAT family N-acetyltransferase [Dehalococcoidia bacterium]
SPRPYAIAPLMRDEDRLTFIGDPQICDFMDFVVEQDRAAEAYRDLWRKLEAEEWSRLDLWGLSETSATRPAIAELARAAGYEVWEEQEAVSPRVDLPPTWDDYLATLSKKDRHELRRKLRRLHDGAGEVTLEVHADQASVNAAMEDFLHLHTISRQDKADFMTGAMPSFFRRMASAMAREGLVRLFTLRVGGKAAASVFCFDAGCCLYMYNSGYDPEYAGLSVGLLSKAMVLQWAIENGKESLDFLRGNEPYKYDLGARDRGVYQLTVRRT